MLFSYVLDDDNDLYKWHKGTKSLKKLATVEGDKIDGNKLCGWISNYLIDSNKDIYSKGGNNKKELGLGDGNKRDEYTKIEKVYNIKE